MRYISFFQVCMLGKINQFAVSSTDVKPKAGYTLYHSIGLSSLSVLDFLITLKDKKKGTFPFSKLVF